MTTKNVIDAARLMLNDSVQPYRWTDAELKVDVQLAVNELNRIRPETRYGPNGEYVGTISIPASVADDVDVHDRWTEALAHYVAFLGYNNDSADTVNQKLAEFHLNNFTARAQY